jgi:hypothetical protein
MRLEELVKVTAKFGGDMSEAAAKEVKQARQT